MVSRQKATRSRPKEITQRALTNKKKKKFDMGTYHGQGGGKRHALWKDETEGGKTPTQKSTQMKGPEAS